jgi:tetratricopeptide (TPR) repeat protein
VYESVVPARVNLAYENAMKSYESAAALNPLNPAVYLLAAQLEASIKKLPEAKQFIGKALQVKNNYSDAIFLLSQIQVAENSIKDAITSLLVLAQLNPQDPTIFFQLGLLYYNSGDNVNTGIVLSKAVELSPDYSNARYFLGLAYARLGKYAEAVDQFEAVARLNPDNEEVANILTALKAGKSPFQAVTTPEKAKTPPVKDSIDKKTSTKVKTR